MDTDVLASLFANIVGGVPKEQSPFVTDDETSQMWDDLSADLQEAPLPAGGQWEMVNEIP